MKKVYTHEVPELRLGQFVTDGYPYVVGYDVVNVIQEQGLKKVDPVNIIVPKWSFIALLDEERNIEKLLINPDSKMGDQYADEFLAIFDPELERKLDLDEYLFSFDSSGDDRYLSVRVG